MIKELGKDRIPKRAIRRHHYQRLKNKRQHYWKWPTDEGLLEDVSLGICVNTPTLCSSPCCGNPRRYFRRINYSGKEAK